GNVPGGNVRGGNTGGQFPRIRGSIEHTNANAIALANAAVSARSEFDKIEKLLVVRKPWNDVPGRRSHLVLHKMVVVVGHEEGMRPQPWLGRLLSVEKGRVKIHWYRQRKAIETKLDGTFWPLYQEDNAKAPDCGYV